MSIEARDRLSKDSVTIRSIWSSIHCPRRAVTFDEAVQLTAGTAAPTGSIRSPVGDRIKFTRRCDKAPRVRE